MVRRGAPRRAVYLSCPGSDLWTAREIATEISAVGATVFLDEANIIRRDAESQVLTALNAADEILILLTSSERELLTTARAVSLDRRFMWLAVGVAWARSIPIVG